MEKGKYMKSVNRFLGITGFGFAIFRKLTLVIFCVFVPTFFVPAKLIGQACSDYTTWTAGMWIGPGAYCGTPYGGTIVTSGGRLYQHRGYCANNGPGNWDFEDIGGCTSCSVAAASSSPTVCEDEAITDITHTTSGVSGITSSTGLPAGVSASYSANTVTISGTPTTAGTYNYTIDVDGCDDDATGTITVNANPSLATAVDGYRYATGTVDIEVSGVPGGTTIDWYTAASGGSALSSGSSTYTTPTINVSTTYYAETRNTTTGCVSETRRAVEAIVSGKVKDNNTTNQNVGSSWTSGSAPTSSDTAVWDETVTGANTTVLGADANYLGLEVINPGGTVTINSGNALTLGSSGVMMGSATQDLSMNNTITLDANQSWDVAVSRILTAAGAISGAYKITKSGSGYLTLSGTNTFSGGVDLNAGTLNLNSAAALGSTAGTLTIASNATIDNISGESVILNNYPISIGGNFTYPGTDDLNMGAGAVTLTASPQITTSTGNLTFGGVIGGSYGITKAGSGTLTLNGANTFTGGVDLNVGTLELGNTNAMGTTAGTIYIGSGTTIDNVSGGTLSLADYNYEFEGDFTFTGTNQLNMGSGNVVLTANTEITMTNSPMVIDGIVSGAFNITKDGSGHLYLNNTANTFTGKVTINHTSSSNGAVFYKTIGNVGGGASSLGAPASIANGTISIGNGAYGGKLMFTGSSDQSTDRVIDLASTTGEVQLDAGDNANLTFTSDFTATGAGSKTLALRGTTSSNTISGDIIDNSGGNTTSLDKRESGTWIFTADMSYTGSTTISDGTLQLGNGGTTGSITSSTVANSGTLVVNRSNDWTYSGVISGTGALTKSGAGKLTLSGVNTYTGNTTINEGTIELGAADRISNSSEIVLGGGTFSTGSGAGNSETVGVLTLTDTSTITLGTGNHTLSFAASSGSSWTASKLLTIEGWSGGFDGTAAGASDPKVFVGSGSGDLTAGQLDMITFLNGGDSQKYMATLRGDGELVPGTTLLPVDLIEFSVRWEGEQALITWATASEINADYFDVQWSIDGENFYSIGEVSASGNTSYRMEYSFVHEQPELVNYYRLIQYDYDGKKYRKPMIVLTKSNGDKGTMYPNPIGRDGVLYFDSPTDDANASIRVIDGSGKVIYSARMPIAEGVNMLQVPSYSWPAGYYNFEVGLSETTYRFNLINQ
jgi:autotransporter-associated beta strand protein